MHLIVHLGTSPATVTDVDHLPAVHADLERKGLLPHSHIVDAGYISINHIIDSRERYGIGLLGPLPPDSGWQVRSPGVRHLRVHDRLGKSAGHLPSGQAQS